MTIRASARFTFFLILGLAAVHSAGARGIRTDLGPPYGNGGNPWCLVGATGCTFVSHSSPPGSTNVSGAPYVSEFAITDLQDDTDLVTGPYNTQFYWPTALEWNFTASPVTATQPDQPALGQIVEFMADSGSPGAYTGDQVCSDYDTATGQTCSYLSDPYNNFVEFQYNYANGTGCDTGAKLTFGATTYISDVVVSPDQTLCDNTFMFLNGSLLGGIPTGWSVASAVDEPGTLYLSLAAAGVYFGYALFRRRKQAGHTP